MLEVQELGREPTSEEIAKCMDSSVDQVRKTKKIAQKPVSLETPIGEEGDTHLGDFLEDKTSVSPSDAVAYLGLQEHTSSALKALTPREEKIIKMRFGLEDGREQRPLPGSNRRDRDIESSTVCSSYRMFAAS